MDPTDHTYVSRGFSTEESRDVAAIYDAAFASKLRLAIPDEVARRAVLEACFDPEWAFVARRAGRVIGVAGVQTREGSLTGAGQWRDLTRTLGWSRAFRALAVFSAFERRVCEGELLMDGIAVAEHARGAGAGSALLSAVLDYARAEGFDAVRLDVIASNPRARALYERVGFIAEREESYEWLRPVLGFGASTTMRFPLGQDG